MSPSDLAPAAAKSRPLVLVIDDDPSVHKVLGRYLDGLGLEAAVADDGQAGLDFLAMHEVALVCVDLMLPTKSGFVVCETVRHGWKWHDTPLLVISCRSSLEARAQAEEVGANGYLVKPFRRAEFESQVRRLLKAEPHFS
jgi:two-component system, OmpR family, response regulator